MTNKRVRYSNEVRAQVIAALLSGQSAVFVSRQFNVPIGTVRSWWSRENRGANIVDTTDATRTRIGELIVEYLSEALQTMIAQVRVARDEKWLKAQEGSQFAVLHGVISDKATRIIEVIAQEEQGDTE